MGAEVALNSISFGLGECLFLGFLRAFAFLLLDLPRVVLVDFGDIQQSQVHWQFVNTVH